MTYPNLSDSLVSLLKKVDTPTVCNAIEVAQKQRGFAAFTRKTMLSSDPDAGPMVGFAHTAKIAALHPPTEQPDVIKGRRLAYFEHMASGDGLKVAVVEDVDYPECIGAWWGEVHTVVHKGLGLSGALTNGVMRDLGDLADSFPVVAASVGPSHGFVHVREVGGEVREQSVFLNGSEWPCLRPLFFLYLRTTPGRDTGRCSPLPERFCYCMHKAIPAF